MKTLPPPDETATSLIREKLPNPAIQHFFSKKTRNGKISLLLTHLIGSETERFAAEPVYSVTGKGYLKSKGVDGMIEEENLEKFLRGSEGREYVNEVLALIKKKLLTKKNSSIQ